MTLMRMPLSVWGIFMATILALLAFPALLVSAIMMALDNHLGTSFFMPAIMSLGDQTVHKGGSPLLFQHLFWFFGHPEVYIVALPAFGIVSDLISTHARRHIFGYRMMVWAILAIGVLSFVVWAHHMYVSGMNPYFGFFFATTTLIIAIPTAIKVYNWVLTLWRGDVHLTVPMLFAIGFVFTFINGGLTGLFLGNVTVDVPLSDTLFVVAHFHMVMGVSPVLVVCGAIYHWYPKMTGRMMDDTLGRLHFWLTLVGTYAIFLPMHYLGILGVPRRYFALGRDLLHPGLGAVDEREHQHRGADRGRGTADLHLQHDLEPEARQARRPQSLARDHARVADTRNPAASRQLGPGTARRLPLGLRIRRARQQAKISCRRTSRPIGHTAVARRPWAQRREPRRRHRRARRRASSSGGWRRAG